MLVLELKSLQILNNDIYLLEIFDQKIILNDQYLGLQILDSNLNIEKKIFLKDNISIYHIYKNPDACSLLLYCPDDQEAILVEFATSSTQNISIEDCKIFSPLYMWKNNTILFATYDYEYYLLDLKNQLLTSYDEKKVQNEWSLFDAFVTDALQHKGLLQVNPIAHTYLYDNETDVVFRDYPTNTTIKNKSSLAYHDAIFQNDTFAFISENGIEIKDLHNNVHMIKYTNPLYIFLRARFLQEDNRFYLFALLSNKSNNLDNIVIKYEIER